jgi:cell division transport system ATP-binding protein
MIRFSDVALSYPTPEGGRRPVFEDVSFEVGAGEFVYLVGQTGTGKSSLLKLLYMDREPDRGVVHVGHYRSDQIKRKEVPYLRRSLGIVFQDFQLLADRNAFDNVAFALYATGKSGAVVKQRVLQVLARVGLTHRQRALPHELSGGEQQRACIARALANEPMVLLADEPTGNLDPHVADGIHDLLIRLHRQGMTVLMATHDYRLVRRFPSRTLALTKRRLIEVAPEGMGAEEG